MNIKLSDIGFHADNLFVAQHHYLLTGWSRDASYGVALILDQDGKVETNYTNNPLLISNSFIVNGSILQNGFIVLHQEPRPTHSQYGQNQLLKFDVTGQRVLQYQGSNANSAHGSSYMLPDDNGGVYVSFYNENSVRHYLNNGALDIEFGVDGVLNLSLSMGFVGYMSIHNDVLYICGGNHAFQLQTYQLNGTPANVFQNNSNAFSYAHNGGHYIGPIVGEIGGCGGFLHLSNGKIILIGDAPNHNQRNAITLMRLNEDGSLDSTFGNAGVIQTSVAGIDLSCVGSGYHCGFAVSDEAFYVSANLNGNCFVAKYNFDGQIDQTWTDKIIAQMPQNMQRGTSIWSYGYRNFFVAVQQDGDIMVFGSASTEENAAYLNSQNVAIFNAQGELKQNIFSAMGEINGTLIDDTITGSDEVDNMMGNDGNDILDADAGNDTLNGGLGDDKLIGGAGDDILMGGAGKDVADYSDSESDLAINLKTGQGSGDDIGLDSISEIEIVYGGAGDDTLTSADSGSELIGGAGDDEIIGGAGDDILQGGYGDDIVNAGNGDDLIIGGDGAGDDHYNGGAGKDRVKYTSALAGISVNLQLGTATSAAGNDQAHIGTDSLSNIESIIAGNCADILFGNYLANDFTGLTGDDEIVGGYGIDTAKYRGLSTEYSVIKNNHGSWSVIDSVAGRDGSDTLSDIEQIQFSNETITLEKAPITRYYISGDDNFSFFNLDQPNDTLRGSNIQLIGSSAVDSVLILPGYHFDFSNSGDGVDQIYIQGLLTDFNYSKSDDGQTLTLISENTELIFNVGDQLIYSDGLINVSSLINLVTSTDPSDPYSIDVANGIEGWTSSVVTLPREINVSNAALHAYSLSNEGVIFGQVNKTIFQPRGSAGLDIVYVTPNSKVDATDLSDSEDVIYLSGAHTDYEHLVMGNILILSAGDERVSVMRGDRLFFLNGSVTVADAILADQGNWVGMGLVI